MNIERFVLSQGT